MILGLWYTRAKTKPNRREKYILSVLSWRCCVGEDRCFIVHTASLLSQRGLPPLALSYFAPVKSGSHTSICRAPAVPTDCACTEHAEYKQWRPAVRRLEGTSEDWHSNLAFSCRIPPTPMCSYTKRMDYLDIASIGTMSEELTHVL